MNSRTTRLPYGGVSHEVLHRVCPLHRVWRETYATVRHEVKRMKQISSMFLAIPQMADYQPC